MKENILKILEKDTAFKSFEQSGWEQVAYHYHQLWGAMTQQAVPQLLACAKIEQGDEVMDLATGAGYAASQVRKLGATATGVDFSAKQIVLAKQEYPSLKFVVGDMEELSFQAESFNAVVMNLGLLHTMYPDKVGSEVYKVLKEKGRFAFTVWSEPELAIGMKILNDAIDKFGDIEVGLPPAMPYFNYSDPQEVLKLFANTGFDLSGFKHVPLTWRFEGSAAADMLFQCFNKGAVRSTALPNRQTHQAKIKIREYMASVSERYRISQNLIEIPMNVALSVGIKK